MTADIIDLASYRIRRPMPLCDLEWRAEAMLARCEAKARSMARAFWKWVAFGFFGALGFLAAVAA